MGHWSSWYDSRLGCERSRVQLPDDPDHLSQEFTFSHSENLEQPVPAGPELRRESLICNYIPAPVIIVSQKVVNITLSTASDGQALHIPGLAFFQNGILARCTRLSLIIHALVKDVN